MYVREEELVTLAYERYEIARMPRRRLKPIANRGAGIRRGNIATLGLSP